MRAFITVTDRTTVKVFLQRMRYVALRCRTAPHDEALHRSAAYYIREYTCTHIVSQKCHRFGML